MRTYDMAKDQQYKVLSFLSPCLPPLSFRYFLCMPLYLSFHRFTSFIGSSVFNFYRPWVFFPGFFSAFISGLETCFKDFLSISLWLLLPFLVLYFIVLYSFSISFFDFPFLNLFTSFLFTVLNSFHHNLLYSYADVIFLPLFLMSSISQVRRSSERCFTTVLKPFLHGGTLSCHMSGLFFRHLQLPATSLPVQPAGLQRFLVAEFFMSRVCVCVCVWPTVVRQLTKIWWAYDFPELGGGGEGAVVHPSVLAVIFPAPISS